MAAVGECLYVFGGIGQDRRVVDTELYRYHIRMYTTLLGVCGNSFGRLTCLRDISNESMEEIARSWRAANTPRLFNHGRHCE